MKKYKIHLIIIAVVCLASFVIAGELISISSQPITLNGNAYTTLSSPIVRTIIIDGHKQTITTPPVNISASNVTCDRYICWYTIDIGDVSYPVRTLSYKIVAGENVALNDTELLSTVQGTIASKLEQYANPEPERTGEIRILGGVVNITA
jgi:hypothetical protein